MVAARTKAKKLDLYVLHKSDYVAPRTPVLLEIQTARYLVIAGGGRPGDKMFQTKIGALYNVAFTIKMACKFAGRDYAVCKLEGLWWGHRQDGDFLAEPPGDWNWKLMIRVPDFIGGRDLSEAIAKLKARGKAPEVAEVALERLAEGRCVQMLHVGPYAKEGETIARMKEFAGQQGFAYEGLHHEIYLSDPRRVAPERLRTILRQPLRKV